MFKKASPHEWLHPKKDQIPPHTKEFNANALQTTFTAKEPSSNKTIHMNIPLYEDIKEKKSQYGGLKYVFFLPKSNKWYNNNNMDYMIKFYSPSMKSGPGIPDYIADIIDCEVNYSQWTLSHRYNKTYDCLNQITDLNYQWILVYIRYSYARLLTWQRNTNTPPRVLSGALSRLTHHLSGLFINAYKSESSYRNLSQSPTMMLRMIISMLGKGTGNGQAIRDDILRIMHKHKLPRKGAYFYEQWHQKLHNNSTPDDIVICEALLAFLRSNNIEEYRRVLKEGGVTKERLASYERNITTEPHHNYDYIGDFEIFLNILKSVHSNNDIVMMFNSAKYIIGNKCYVFDDIIKNKDVKDTNAIIGQIEKVVNGRKITTDILNNICIHDNNSDKVRDLVFFDLSLESYLRQLIEKIIHINLSYETYIHLITLMIDNIKFTYRNYIEVGLISDDWNEIVFKHSSDYSYDNMLKVKSVYYRVMRLLNSITDFFNSEIQPKASYLGKEFNIDKEHIEIFSEELIRGTIFFCLSMLLRKIEKIIREKTSNSNWLMISRGEKEEVKGKAKYYHSMNEVQFEKFDKNTVLIVDEVNGDEEIPEGCVCLIIINEGGNYPDVLSHISVRARNMKVVFTVCFDEGKRNELKNYSNKNVKITIVEGDIKYEQCDDIGSNDKNEQKDESEIRQKIIDIINTKEDCEKLYLELDEYDSKYIGAKSLNTLKLYNKVPNVSWLKYPNSFSIPFSTMNKLLSLEENANVNNNLKELFATLSNKDNTKEKITSILSSIKKQIQSISFPKDNNYIKEIDSKLISFGISQDKLDKAHNAMKEVWSSISNTRVYISLSKYNIGLSNVKMSILVQKIIPSDYAFVIHTKNPINNNPSELFGEVVNGMGETLVGAYEGQGFSFIYNKDTKQSTVCSYQNKSVKLISEGDFIFRSDSNIEDIENFSGAGLFDSVPIEKDKCVDMKYKDDGLFTDVQFRNKIIQGISDIGINIEKLFNGEAQDIEGVYSKGEFYVVQTRPQV